MDGGPSKINPPNSHPSNPIHKAAMAAQNPKPAVKTPIITDDEAPLEKTPQPHEEAPLEKTPQPQPQHEINKAAVIIGVLGVAALLYMAT